MSIWQYGDIILRTHLHQRRSEAITRQGPSGEGVWSSWEQGSRPQLPRNGWLPGQLYTQLCSHSSTTPQADPERDQIPVGDKRGAGIWEDQREHLRLQNHGLLRSWEANHSAHRSKLQRGSICSATATDGEGHTTSALHQPDNDWNRKAIQSNREGRAGHQVGKGETQRIPPWSAKIQDSDSPQTTTASLQQSEDQDAAKDREMGNGNAGCWLWTSLRARQGRGRPPRLSLQAPSTRDREWSHWEDCQMDNGCGTCCSDRTHQRGNTEGHHNAEAGKKDCQVRLGEAQTRPRYGTIPACEAGTVSSRRNDLPATQDNPTNTG